jgi:hypothetical protein
MKLNFGLAVKILLMLHIGIQAQAMTHDVEVTIPLRVAWMAPDGHGGIYIKSNNELYRVTPKGEMLPLAVPYPSPSDSVSLARMELFVSPDGYLWRLEFPYLFRLSKQGAWEGIPVSKPYEKDYVCRIWGHDSIHLEMLCKNPVSLDAPSIGLSAKVEWPRISDWKPYPVKADTEDTLEGNPLAGQPPSWMDINKQTQFEMKLVLEHNRLSNWRKSIWTFTNPDSGGGKDTIPYPHRWSGPRQSNGMSGFSTIVPLMAKSGGNVWIVLDQLIALRSDSSWTLIFSSARNRADQALKRQVPKRDSSRASGGKSHTLVRAVPYLATTYLIYSAVQSGPGWASEAGWAYGGTMLGMVGGVVGLNLIAGPCWNGSCPEAALPYLVSLLATLPLMGAAWAVQSHDTRTDRQWQRFGGAILGAATGIGVYFVAPDARHSVLLGLASFGMGAVVGYRFAWY